MQPQAESSPEEQIPHLVRAVLAPLKKEGELLKRPQRQSQIVALVVQKLGKEDLQDLVAQEVRHQLEALLDPERLRNRQIGHFIDFLKTDVETSLKEAVTLAVEKRARNVAALERIAHEASLNIHQVLLRAKKEFGADSPLAAPVREAVNQVIQELDEKYSVDDVLQELQERLGMRQIERTRMRLQKLVVAAINRYLTQEPSPRKVKAYVNAILKKADSELKAAKEKIQTLQDPLLQKLALEDLDELRALYADRELLMHKLENAGK
jgi:molybdopterin converting factor small subunit